MAMPAMIRVELMICPFPLTRPLSMHCRTICSRPAGTSPHQAPSSEEGDGGIIRHVFIHSQSQEVFAGEIDTGILSDLPVRITIDVLQQAQPEQKLRVFRLPAEIRSVSILHQVIDEREINGLVDFPKQVVLRHNLIVQMAAVE